MQSCMKGRWMQSCMKGHVDAELYERAGGYRVV